MPTILKRLWDFVWVPGTPGAAASEPSYLARGRELLRERPRRLEILAELKDLQIGMRREERPARVDDLAASFAAWVVDLPASERHHDAGAFGLLDHSLEVSRRTLSELVRPSFRVSEDPAFNYREQPIWAYAGFVLGLLHDLGKALDLEVILAEGAAPWNPLAEPLAAFLAREGRHLSGPESWHWEKGRGLVRHVGKASLFLPLVVPPTIRSFLGKRLDELFALYDRVSKDSASASREETGPAAKVVAALRRADGEDVERTIPPKEKIYLLKPPVLAPFVKSPEPILAPAPELFPSDSDPVSPVIAPPPEAPLPAPGASGIATAPSRDPGPSLAAPQEKPPVSGGKEPKAPSDRARRLDALLQPERLLGAIQNWLRAGTMLRNNAHAAVFMRPDYIWLRYPEALSELLRAKGIEWSTLVAEKLLGALRKLPQVAPENPRSTLVCARTGARASKPLHFVRLRAPGFLPLEELAGLGYWPHELTQVPSIPVAEGERLLWPLGR